MKEKKMLKPFNRWVLEVKKSYVSLEFEFNTPDGLNDFYEVLRDALITENVEVTVRAYTKEEEE